MRRVCPAIRLADLLYGHPGQYLQRLGRVFDPALVGREPICLGELTCGCWIVLDGNNRTGLLLATNPNATLADYPAAALVVYPKGSWDPEMIEWWNPAPKTFAEVMCSKRITKRRRTERSDANLKTFYGFIERTSDGDYYGVITSLIRHGGRIAARSSTPTQLEGKLRTAVRRHLKKVGTSSPEDFDIKLSGCDESIHVCRQTSDTHVQAQR